MLTQLKITVDPPPELNLGSYLAPMLQGVIMERIDPEYAEALHISALHPYSQYTEGKNGKLIWTVNTLNKESRSELINILNDREFDSIYLKNKDMTLNITDKIIKEISYDELLRTGYFDGGGEKYAQIEFVTPTSFKKDRQYIIFPTSSFIMNSLAKKYDSCCSASTVADELLYEYIKENTAVVEYYLRSVKFSMEGISIPSFLGTVKLKFGGNREFRCLMNMLLKFGEFSGVGIKSAMGMGAMRIKKGGKKLDR